MDKIDNKKIKSTFIIRPDLRIMSTPDKWALASLGVWRSPEMQLIIPSGFVTDLASIPKILRWLLDVNGRSRYPAILHDWLYCGQWTTRAFADEMLYRALIGYGECRATATLYWLGVRAGGWKAWNSRNGLRRDFFSTEDAFRVALALQPPCCGFSNMAIGANLAIKNSSHAPHRPS